MISKSQIASAKRGDLPGMLEMLGVNLIRDGKGYQSASHDSLKLFQRDGIWLYKWWSRDGEVGDGIQYLQRYFNMSFLQAVQLLSGVSITSKTKQVAIDWHTTSWQQKSARLISAAGRYLFKPNGKERLKYLIEDRGLQIETIKRYHLGWLPAQSHMPSKIVVPCYNSRGGLIRIRFRIDEPKENGRYRISKGSDPSSPYPIGVAQEKPVIIVESELDAILIAQEAGDIFGVVGTGSTSSKLTASAVQYLNNKIPGILICMDNDQSGQDKADILKKELSNSVNCTIPVEYGKDPGEAWKNMDLREWFKKNKQKEL